MISNKEKQSGNFITFVPGIRCNNWIPDIVE